jgi:hypothetical protein
MSIKNFLLAVSTLIIQTALFAQSGQETQIDILSTYYQQDGIHSAVTGGLGTEELEDYSTHLRVNVPIDSASRLLFYSSFNHYSSASSDRIDFRVSSPSAVDNRIMFRLGWQQDEYRATDSASVKSNLKKIGTWDAHFSASIESDYLSSGIGFSWSDQNESKTQSWNFGADLYLDRWILYFPSELRNDSAAPSVPTDRRRSLIFKASFEQIINRRLKFSWHFEPAIQQGLLSTPFHRVYVQDLNTPVLESLPLWRTRIPLAMRINYAWSPNFFNRFYLRAYADNWGILSYTAQLETPWKISRGFHLSPYYRFHQQQAATYFAPFGLNTLESEFKTSDFDLSSFHAHQIGLGIDIVPLRGIGANLESRKSRSAWRSMHIRTFYYRRSDSLEAFMGSFEFKFAARKKSKSNDPSID